MTAARACGVVLAVGLVSACEPTGGDAPSCAELGVVIAGAGPAERRVLGSGEPYEADPMLASRMDELARSQRVRREVAWAAVARVLAPVALAEETSVAGAQVPVFRTWYDRDDVNRMFQHAYAGLGPERRQARAPFEATELDETFAWNPRAIDEISGWTPERFESYLGSFHAQREIDGLGGFRRVALSPDAARHVLASYAEITRCLDGERPEPFVDGAAAERELTRIPLALTRCHEALEGPFFVATGATLRVRLESGATDASVLVRASDDGIAGTTLCTSPDPSGCEVPGPGAFFVGARAGADDLRGALVLDLEEAERITPGCLRGAFPLGAATVAAHWQRADLSRPMPTFDTSAAALRRRFDDGTYTWGEGDGTADPGDDAIYTMTLPSGPSYRLAGLHIRTRELEHWLNITLWWSPDASSDFGADRPSSIEALGAPWTSYKMCVAIDFDEGDPAPSGGFDDDAPTLAAALAEVHDDASWCSNPYIDAAPGLLRGNCVGCHQHAMGERAPGEIALDEVRFPNGGRSRTRNNEPADGFWSFDGGDDLGPVLRDTITWWDASE